MTLTRRALRIELMTLLYQYDLYKSENIAFIPNFEHEEVEGFYFQIIDELSVIDELIEKNLFDYKLARLAYVDRAIIRLAVYEMVKTDTAKEVVIDEAVNLTKIYSNLDDEKQHKFTNKLLDNILSFYNDYEYVLFIDSDIVVPSNIIDELLKYADNKTIVAAAISNIPNRTADGTTPCNFMKLNGNRMEHMVKYPTSGVIEVDLTGAVYLVPMQCLKDGVRYDANQQGEDNPFCDSA